MLETIKSFEFTSTMGLLLYWLPMGVCSIGYLVRTWNNYHHDIAKRTAYLQYKARQKDIPLAEQKWGKDDVSYYRPTDTIGALIGRGIMSIVPVCNLLAAVCDVAPSMLKGIFQTIGRIFDQPLVPGE